MRKSASEIIRDLEGRVARLEKKMASKSSSTKKKAGAGAGVELCLSGKSRKVRCLDTYADESRLSAKVDRDGLPVFKGNAGIFDLTIASYYNAKHIKGLAAVIKGEDLTSVFDQEILDMVSFEDRELSDVDSYNITNITLENSIYGGGWTRGSAPDQIEISGIIEIEIEFEDGHTIVDEAEFETVAETTDDFRIMFDILDDVDEDEDY